MHCAGWRASWASGELVTPGADELAEAAFRWHSVCRVFDGAGQEYVPVLASDPLIDDRPSGMAVARAIAAGTFRIGGDGPAPTFGFETLTSGSSAAPRRIARSHQSWIASFKVNSRLFGLGPGAKVAILGRLVQSLALYGAVEAVHLGSELHLLDDLRPDRQRAALARSGIGHLYATPVQMRLLAECDGTPLPDLGTIVLGGSKLDNGLRQAIRSMAPTARIHEFYGAAEASFITLADTTAPEDSVGSAYPGVEIRVEGPDEIGEIWVRSPYLFTGYAGSDRGGAKWDRGWLSVGEMGSLRDGFLFLAGRQGRMVTVADQNVFPEEIEAFLATLAGIDQVAVVPRPDALRGHQIVAVLKGSPEKEAEILRAARQHLGIVKAPKSLVWRQDWPTLPSGKTDLRRINADLGP